MLKTVMATKAFFRSALFSYSDIPRWLWCYFQFFAVWSVKKDCWKWNGNSLMKIEAWCKWEAKWELTWKEKPTVKALHFRVGIFQVSLIHKSLLPWPASTAQWIVSSCLYQKALRVCWGGFTLTLRLEIRFWNNPVRCGGLFGSFRVCVPQWILLWVSVFLSHLIFSI